MQKTNTKAQRAERGVALIAVMLTLALVTAIAAGIIILANTETKTSANFKDEQRAFFAAKAGVEEARDRLRQGVTTSGYSLTTTAGTLPTTLPGSGSTGVIYITNAASGETVAPWCASITPVSATCAAQYPDDELCKETLSGSSVTCSTDSTTGKSYPSGSYYTTTTASSTLQLSSGPVLDWKWARVTQKQNNQFGANYYVNGASGALQVLWNGNSECVTGSTSTCTLPVYVITALAVTPSGSRRMVQMEVAQDQLNFTAPSALTLDGAGDTFTGANSNNYQVSGNDAGGCGSGAGTAPAVPAIGVPAGDTTDQSAIVNQIDATVNYNTSKEGNYSGSGATSPDVEPVSLPSSMSSVSAVQTLVSQLKNDVTQPVLNCPTGCSGLSTPGSLPGNPQIIYVNGDLTVSGSTTGGGILIVTGNLTFKGTAEWDGLVLVVGKGNFTMDGTNTFKGAVVVADTVNSSGGTLSVLGAAHGSVSGGGSSRGGIYYSNSCLNQGTKLTTYHSVSYRELIN